MKKDNPKENPNQWLEFLSLGWILGGTMTLTVGGGIWLDKHYSTLPIFLLIGSGLGFVGCGFKLFQVIQKLNLESAAKLAKKPGSQKADT